MEATSGELTVAVFDGSEQGMMRDMMFAWIRECEGQVFPVEWRELLDQAGWWPDEFASCPKCDAVVDTHPMAGDWNVVNGLCDLCVPDELQELREIESDDETVNDLRMMAEECPDGAAAVLLQVRALMEGSGN